MSANSASLIRPIRDLKGEKAAHLEQGCDDDPLDWNGKPNQRSIAEVVRPKRLEIYQCV